MMDWNRQFMYHFLHTHKGGVFRFYPDSYKKTARFFLGHGSV